MKRRKFTAEFKFKVAVAAISEQQSLAELAKKHQLAPAQISAWKRELLAGVSQIFAKPGKPAGPDPQTREDELLRIIGQLQVENSFLIKS